MYPLPETERASGESLGNGTRRNRVVNRRPQSRDTPIAGSAALTRNVATSGDAHDLRTDPSADGLIRWVFIYFFSRKTGSAISRFLPTSHRAVRRPLDDDDDDDENNEPGPTTVRHHLWACARAIVRKGEEEVIRETKRKVARDGHEGSSGPNETRREERDAPAYFQWYRPGPRDGARDRFSPRGVAAAAGGARTGCPSRRDTCAVCRL